MHLQSFLLSILALASMASAQLFTSVLPVDDGNTLIVSRTLNAVGMLTYIPVSTLGLGGAAVATTTPTTTRRTSTARTTARSSTTTAGAAAPTLTTGRPNADGVAVTPASGTRLSYEEFSLMVASPLSSAYYATASSAAGQRVPSWSTSSSVLVSIGLAVGAVGAGALLA